MADDLTTWQDDAAQQLLDADSSMTIYPPGFRIPPEYRSPPTIEDKVFDPIQLSPGIRDMIYKEMSKPLDAAAARAVMSPQLMPETQRRSENVEYPSPAMRREMPSWVDINPEAVNEEHSDIISMRHDLRDNPHSADYIRDIGRIMYEGGHTSAIDAQKHPLLNREAAVVQRSPMAQQLGAASLVNMMKAQAAKKVRPRMPEDMYRQLSQIQHGDYDAGLYLAKRMLEAYRNPRRNPQSDTGGMP